MTGDRTQRFYVLRFIQYIKVNYLMLFFRKIQFFCRRVFSLLLRLRQSLNNNGFKQTVFISVRALKGVIRKITMTLSDKKKAKERHEDAFASICKTVTETGLNLNARQCKILSSMYLHEYYVAQVGVEDCVSPGEGVRHFLQHGLGQGFSPSPLFNQQLYLEKAGLCRDEMSGPVFLHWLRFGVEKQIAPSCLIDAEFLIDKYHIALDEKCWVFEFYITDGVLRNLAPNQYFDPDWYRLQHDAADSQLPSFYHYLSVGYKHGWRPSRLFPSFARTECAQMSTSPLEQVMTECDFAQLRTRTSASPVLLDQIQKAHKIESKIKLPSVKTVQRLNIHPYSHPCFPAVKSLRQSLEGRQFSSIVLIPHCRYGGSALVAGELCHSLLRCFTGENVLLVRTDNDDFMRPDWFPENLEIVNLLDFGCDLQDEYRQKILLDLLIGLRPKRIFNVHSRLGWQVFQEFGDRLSQWSSLYGYTFCYDVNMLGAKVGYPIKYVPNCIEYMEKLFVDNSFVKSDMAIIHNWTEKQDSKVEVLWTPHQGEPTCESTASLEISDNGKKNIFWAGRFDRQKRFDLVVKLAKDNPQWEFWVWGAAMLGDDKVTNNLPSNLHLNGLFNAYSEIPFEQCDVWLYTSQWDGVPTILIELGLREVPIVAAKIWGTADLIQEHTAWPVTNVTETKGYQAQLEQALSNPEEKLQKSKRLKSLILEQHSRKKYDESLVLSLSAGEG